METIMTPAGSYTPTENALVRRASASLNRRGPPDIIHFVQYDRTLPIIAVDLTYGDQPFAVPTNAEVNIRMRKPDGKHVHDPALGLTDDRQTVYIGVTQQMTAAAGRGIAIIEIVVDDGAIGTSPVTLEIDRNPVPEDTIESMDENLTAQDLSAQAAQAAQQSAK